MVLRTRVTIALVACLLGVGGCSSESSSTDGNTSATGGTSNSTAGGASSTVTTTDLGDVVVSRTAAAFSGSCERLDLDEEDTWDENDEILVSLSDSGMASSSAVTTIDGLVTISSPGTYRLVGSLTTGRVVVDCEDSGVVRLVLDGVEISSPTDPAIQIVNADRVALVLADGSENHLSDGATYGETTDANAALYSQDDLTITGSGSLDVIGNYGDGITSKDALVIKSGAVTVSAVDDGIRGKDCLLVSGGSLFVTSGGDGLKADNDEDTSLGYVAIKDGTLDVTAGGDGIAATTSVYVTKGKVKLTTGGGSSQTVATDMSAKGIKGAAGVVIDDGELEIDSADDALHAGGAVYLNGADFTIASADDGIHSDATVELSGPVLTISKSYEGIEGTLITINDGDIHIVSSDDAINASDGSGASSAGMGTMPAAPTAGTIPGAAATGGASGTSSVAATSSTTAATLLFTVNGGRLVVDSSGDGLDSNGNIVINGGVVIVNGPTDDGNGALDIGDGAGFSLTVNGGVLVAAGSSGMAVGPSATSTQGAVLLTSQSSGVGGRVMGMGTSSGFAAGMLVHIESADGESVLTFAPAKTFASIVFSSPMLKAGTYRVLTGGSCTGTVIDCLYEGGYYSAGSEETTFTLNADSAVVSAVWTP
ncbi:MAG: carbohydrate-binding domain-containing protein [Polyangiaceae bacterium]